MFSKEKIKNIIKENDLLWRILIDIPLYLTTYFLTMLFYENFVPRKPGFHCNDLNLSKPHLGDTVHMKHIIQLVQYTPAFILFIGECLRCDSKSTVGVVTLALNSLKTTVRFGINYAIGFLCVHCIVLIFKITVCEPRPDFFDTCVPDKLTSCKGSEFIMYYTCRGNKTDVNETMMSFPSGHSCFIAYYAFFFIFYIQYRLLKKERRSLMFYPLIQVTLLIGAFTVCASRVTDFRHHWWDVAAGVIIGVAVAAYTIRTLCHIEDMPHDATQTDYRKFIKVPTMQKDNLHSDIIYST